MPAPAPLEVVGSPGGRRVIVDPVTGNYEFEDEYLAKQAKLGQTTTQTQAPVAPAFAQAPAAAPGTPGDTDAMLARLRQIVMDQLAPTRGAARMGAINAFQRMAQGSPQAVGMAVAPQRMQLANSAFGAQRQLSQAMGPFAGGQITQGHQDVMQQMLPQMAALYTQAPEQARQTLLKYLNSSGAFMASPASTSSGTSTSTTETPFNPQMMALGVQGLSGLGRSAYDLYSMYNRPTMGFGTGQAPATGSLVPPGGYYP